MSVMGKQNRVWERTKRLKIMEWGEIKQRREGKEIKGREGKNCKREALKGNEAKS